jgi:hypothetical protein
MLLIALMSCSSSPRPSPTAEKAPSGQPTEAEGQPNKTLLEDDFSKPKCGWTTRKDPSLTAGCVNGAYRILLKHPKDDYESFVPINESLRAVSVEVDATSIGAPGLVGVLCSLDHGLGDYYAFLIRPDAGEYFIFKTTPTNGGRVLTRGRARAAVLPGTDDIKGECMGGTAGEPTVLTMWVNGHQLAQLGDSGGFHAFDGLGLMVFSLEKSGTGGVFDKARMSGV